MTLAVGGMLNTTQQYKKTVDSLLLSRSMRTNGKGGYARECSKHWYFYLLCSMLIIVVKSLAISKMVLGLK